MDYMVDQPLDAIIQTKKAAGRGRGRGRGRGGRGRGRGGAVRRNSMGGGGGVGGGGGGRGFRRQFNRSRQASGGGGGGGGKWQHDMFQGGFNGVSQAQTPAKSGGSKLLISNLDYGVSDDDIKELFREFGRLRKAEVHYDKSGRSVGTAQVIFERNVDALKAIKQYNGVPLDGRPMSIQLMDGSGQGKTFTSTPNKSNVRQRVGPRLSSGGGGGGEGRGGGRGGRGRGRGRGGRGGKKQEVPTAEQLDADLEAYKQSTDSWTT